MAVTCLEEREMPSGEYLSRAKAISALFGMEETVPEKWTGSDFGKIQRRQSPWTLPLLVGKRKEGTAKNNREGRAHGDWTSWCENGQKQLQQTVRFGKIEGAASRWYKNGVKKDDLFMQTAKSFQLWYGNRMV